MSKTIWVSSEEEKEKFGKWINENIELSVLKRDTFEHIKHTDYFSNTLGLDESYNNIDLSKTFEKMLTEVIKEITYAFDYYYIKNALSDCYDGNIENVLSGSSYCLYGVNEKLIEKSKNLGLPAQDLYYTLRGLYPILASNLGIKNVVLLCGPYYLYSDLSMTQNPTEITRVSRVYVPLFEDCHNAKNLQPRKEFELESTVWDVKRIIDLYAIKEYQQGYFNENRTREATKTKTWDRDCSWLQLTEEEKIVAGKERASQHNKSIAYNESLLENRNLLNDFVNYCNDKRINIFMVLTPVSRYYAENLDNTFITVCYDVLNSLEGEVHLLDLFNSECFEDTDFNDADHLNDNGADKLSLMINDLILSL